MDAIQGWLSKHAMTIILLIVTATSGFVLGQAKGDATQDAQIQALVNQVKDNTDKKVSREEFAQFTESVKIQLQLLNENVKGMREDMRKGR